MKAVLCPVCNGRGMIPCTLSAATEIPCPGCAEWGSKGWLLVPEVEDLPMPYGDGDDITYDTSDTYKPIFTY